MERSSRAALGLAVLLGLLAVSAAGAPGTAAEVPAAERNVLLALEQKANLDLDWDFTDDTGPSPCSVDHIENLLCSAADENGIRHITSITILPKNAPDAEEIDINFDDLIHLKAFHAIGVGLEGDLPRSLVSLDSLKTLVLESNELRGELPVFWSPSLEVIDLQGNFFIGAIGSLGQRDQFPNLKVLFLADNRFDCPIPRYDVIPTNDREWFEETGRCHPDNLLEELSLGALSKLLRLRNTTCQHVVREVIARVKAVDRHFPRLQSIVDLAPKLIARAAGLDRLVESDRGALFCIPIVVKDNIDVATLPTTVGAQALRENMPTRDAFVIQKLRDMGAIIVGKTAMADFGLSGEVTTSSLTGTTRNPYALDRTPWGSSGGSAVAVAASLAVLAIGTDSGGSVLGPASATGLYGLRPSHGKISTDGVFPLLTSRDVVGPLARSLEDCEDLFEFMRSDDFDPDDLSTVEYNVGFVDDSVESALADPEPQVRELALLKAGLLFAAGGSAPDRMTLRETPIGVELTEPALRRVPEIVECFPSMMRFGMENYFKRFQDNDVAPIRSVPQLFQAMELEPGIYPPGVVDAIGAAAQAPLVADLTFVPACVDEVAFQNEFDRNITEAATRAGVEFLLLPFASRTPARFVAGHCDNEPAHSFINFAYFASYSGRPALTIPMGLTDDGIPLGFVIVGPRGRDDDLFEIARRLEKRLGGSQRKPPTYAVHTKPSWWVAPPARSPADGSTPPPAVSGTGTPKPTEERHTLVGGDKKSSWWDRNHWVVVGSVGAFAFALGAFVTYLLTKKKADFAGGPEMYGPHDGGFELMGDDPYV